MSYFEDTTFHQHTTTPGGLRLQKLADTADVPLDRLAPGTRHRLARALEGGFRKPVRRVMQTMEDATVWRDALAQMPKRWWFVHGDLEVVVTGFGPFQSHAFNPSKPFAKAVAAGLSRHLASSYEGLGVTFQAADEFVRLQDYDSQPVLVHCGLAEKRETIGLERYAHNIVGSQTDNDGRVGEDGCLLPGGPLALETLLPIDALGESLSEALATGGHVPVETSRDAGTYVCNALYYRSLMAVRQTRLADRAAEAIFVHVPGLSADAASRSGRIIGEEIGGFLVSALNDQSVAALE
jgi:pyroglutamyl-peptidase